MKSYTFQLEVVTPLFLSGADQSHAELRAPSFKGALRFWFRALMGENLSLKELKDIGEDIFGNTKGASKVSLHFRYTKPPPVTLSWQEVSKFQPSQRVSGSLLNPYQGLQYFGFPFRTVGRACFPPGSKLLLDLIPRGNINNDELHYIMAALWLLFTLGGIGTRSRRGLGSLLCTRSPKANLQDVPQPGGRNPAMQACPISVAKPRRTR